MKIVSIVMTVSNWIMRLLFVNILWLVFTLLGVGILGVFPATIAMFTVLRDGIKNGVSSPIWSKFIQVFKAEFVRGNGTGYLFGVIGLITFLDFRFFLLFDQMILQVIAYLFLFLLIIYCVVGVYLFPIYVHYDKKISAYLKQTFLFVCLHPVKTILGVLILFPIIALFYFLPAAVLFFGISLPALLIMWYSYMILIEV